jgi:hypothetical protein
VVARAPPACSVPGMGADLIGWRNCSLQRELEPGGFLGKLKLRSYQQLIEDRVPPDKRAGIEIEVQVIGRGAKALTYEQIREGAEGFRRGSPECAQCPLAGGAPLGCYKYVTYPVDAPAEELLFRFFTQKSQIETKDSISDQLYRDLVSRVPASGTGWHTKRGPGGPLAQRPTPLTHKWGGLFSKKQVDSAQLLQVLFMTLEHPALVVAFGRFWTEFVEFAQANGGGPLRSRGLGELFALQRMMLPLSALAVTDGATLVADS